MYLASGHCSDEQGTSPSEHEESDDDVQVVDVTYEPKPTKISPQELLMQALKLETLLVCDSYDAFWQNVTATVYLLRSEGATSYLLLLFV